MKKICFVFIALLLGVCIFAQAVGGTGAAEEGNESNISADGNSTGEMGEGAVTAHGGDAAESAKADAKTAKEEETRKKAEAKAAAKEERARKKAEAKALKEEKARKKAEEKAVEFLEKEGQNAQGDAAAETSENATAENNKKAFESNANANESSSTSANADKGGESTAKGEERDVYYVAEKYYTSQDYYTSVDGTLTEEDMQKIRESKRRISLSELRKKPIPLVNWGLSYANVTRIQKQEGRSNFVWQNNLFGAFAELQSKNMKPVNSLLRLSIYYPLTHTFNDMSQIQGMFLYAFDLFAAPFIEASMWDYVYLKFGLGLHYMYQLTDEFYFHYLGVGALVGLELPVAPRWTIILDGNFNLDYPNLGSNRIVQPYEYSWQYHIDFGVRYSKLSENPRSYVPKTALQSVLWDALLKREDARRAEQDRIRAEKKIAYLKAHPEKVARKKRHEAKKLAMADAKAARDAENLRAAEKKVAAMFAKEEEKARSREARRAAADAAREKANATKQQEKENKARADAEKKEQVTPSNAAENAEGTNESAGTIKR